MGMVVSFLSCEKDVHHRGIVCADQFGGRNLTIAPAGRCKGSVKSMSNGATGKVFEW
jgi:hypothetical protein